MANSEEHPPHEPGEDADIASGSSQHPLWDFDEDTEGFFAELERNNRDDAPAVRAEPEDFGFDEISTDTADAQSDGGSQRRRGSGRPTGSGRRGSGARRPSPAASPLANPRVRMLIGAVVVVVVIAVAVLLVRNYQRSQLVDGYTSYVTTSSQIAQASAALGPKLVSTMQNSTGQSPTQLQADVQALATQAAQQYRQASQLEAPRAAAQANRALVLALQLRENGLNALVGNLNSIIRSSNNVAASQTIASAMQRFLASDVVVTDSYLAGTAQALRDQSITGVSVLGQSAASFLAAANQGYALPSGAQSLVSSLRQTNASAAGQGTPNGLSLVSVVAEPGAAILTPGIAQNIAESADLHWAVTVQNGGTSIENGIKVSASLSYGTTPVDVETNVIKTINPGQQVVVAIAGPQASAVKLGKLGLLHVQIASVAGEQNVANNAADYPITITFN